MPTNPSRSAKPNRRKTSLSEYQLMLASHRDHPGAHTRAAKHAGVSYNTARKGFFDGFGISMPPIAQVLHGEMTLARSRLESTVPSLEATQALDRFAEEGCDQRLSDARLLRAARMNVGAALVMSNRLLSAASVLVDQLGERLLEAKGVLDLDGLAKVLTEVLDIAQRASTAADVLASHEAKVLGDPALFDTTLGPGPTNLEEALQVLQEAKQFMPVETMEPSSHGLETTSIALAGSSTGPRAVA